jgi:type II secretory pathway predicted ATPase ExeA
MVLDFYQLKEQPFGVTPDPRFLYLSPTHREALASVEYGVSAGRGFTALIARPGMGKTTLLFDFLSKIRDSARTVFLFQSGSTPRDLLRSLLEDLGIQEAVDDIGQMQRKLNECLLQDFKQGKRFIVVIDEAQGLDQSVLEVVRMLSNFETPREKLLHLVLAGQPSLAAMLETPQLLQLRQRISIVARLLPFNAKETRLYIDHRLRVAGYSSNAPLFTKRALALIVKEAGGIPRNINNICFNAMSVAYALKRNPINADVIEEVLRDLDLHSLCEDPTETLKPVPAPAVDLSGLSSAFSVWALRVALSFGLLAALAGTLTLTHKDWMHLPNSLSPRVSVQPSSLSSPPFPTSMQQVSASSPRLSNFSSHSRQAASDKAHFSSAISASQLSAPEGGPSGPTRVVTVQSKQTIFQFCVEIIGRYDDKTLGKIRELNPGLDDLEHIEIGQKIRIPVMNQVPRMIQVVSAQGRGAADMAAEKP